MSTDVSQPTDAQLVLRIGSGDAEAEALLVGRFSRGLSLLLRRLVSNRSLVDDLYQETFRITIQRLRDRGLEHPERLKGFVRGVARNVVLSHRRSQAARLARFDDDPDGRVSEPDQDAQLDGLIRREDALRVRELLDELRADRDRQVLQRLYLEGQSKASICRELGLDARHFDRIVHRAKTRFRRIVRDGGTRAVGLPARRGVREP